MGGLGLEYNEYALEELTESIYSGGTPSRKVSEFWNGEINWLSSGETNCDFITKTNEKIQN